jgi:hypothetical protein
MRQNTDNRWISILVAVAGCSLLALGIGNFRVPVGAQYAPPSIIPPIQPIDVTHTPADMRAISVGPPVVEIMTVTALIGVGQCDSGFPSAEHLTGSLDFLLAIPQDANTEFKRLSPYVVELLNGTILGSVRKPSQTGIVTTPEGDVAYSANSDAFVSVLNNTLRVRNVDGMGQNVKIKLKNGPMSGHTLSIQPGYELVASDHKMNRADLRPADGIARRSFQLFAGGFVAVSQYQLESELQHSALVSSLKQKESTDPKARRILNDMSKMAAVLNQMNGPQGFQ